MNGQGPIPLNTNIKTGSGFGVKTKDVNVCTDFGSGLGEKTILL